MSFADRFASILDMAIAKFETLNPTGKTRYEVLELMTFSLHQAFLIAAESDPDVALLDMFSMVTLGRIFFEEDGPSRYGKVVVPVLVGKFINQKGWEVKMDGITAMIGIVACLALAGWVILRSLRKKPDADF